MISCGNCRKLFGRQVQHDNVQMVRECYAADAAYQAHLNLTLSDDDSLDYYEARERELLDLEYAGYQREFEETGWI
jgi:hypothetical protein